MPVYQPDVVYFQRPFGNPFVSFGLGFAIGAWLNCDFDWGNHHLIVWGHDHSRPADWWSHRPNERPRVEVTHATVWQPRNRPAMAAQGLLDRGYDSHPVHNTVTVIGGKPGPAEVTHSRPANPAPNRSTVTVIGGQPKPAEAPRPRPANAALIGVQSSHQTQQFSTRGQESRQQTTSRPATAPAHSVAPSHPSGSGKH